MKIGIDARMYSSHFTGIGRYSFELIRNIVKLDHQNEYVIFLNPQQYKTFEISSPNVQKVLTDAPYYSLQEQTSFNNLLVHHNLDVVHFTHFNAPLLYHKPFVVTIHDLILSFYKGKKRTSFIERAAYNMVIKNVIKKARHIIAVSEHTKDDIRRLFFVPQEKISVIYEGVAEEFTIPPSPSVISSVQKKFRLDKPFVLYTGVWRDHKNIKGLIEAFALLIKAQKKDIYLVITGKEDPYYPEVKELPKQLGIEQQVRLTGFVTEEELIALYHLALLFVFPSFYEGFGLPLLESMASKTPIVASHTSSIPEIGGDACLYFDPHSPQDIAQKIGFLLQDEAKRQELIAKGSERIKQFSWGKMAEQTLHVYQNFSKL
jgi:glycosyltransferase involved in cell wall biosynthesis